MRKDTRGPPSCAILNRWVIASAAVAARAACIAAAEVWSKGAAASAVVAAMAAGKAAAAVAPKVDVAWQRAVAMKRVPKC